MLGSKAGKSSRFEGPPISHMLNGAGIFTYIYPEKKSPERVAVG